MILYVFSLFYYCDMCFLKFVCLWERAMFACVFYKEYFCLLVFMSLGIFVCKLKILLAV